MPLMTKKVSTENVPLMADNSVQCSYICNVAEVAMVYKYFLIFVHFYMDKLKIRLTALTSTMFHSGAVPATAYV